MIEKPTDNLSLFVFSSDSLVRIKYVVSLVTMMPPERITERSQSSYAYGRSLMTITIGISGERRI